MRRFCLVVLLAVLACNCLPSTAEAKMESWYTYFGIGYANAQYPDGLQSLLDYIEDGSSDGSHISIAIDLIGIYFTLLDERTILGGVFNGAADRYSYDGEWMQINSYLMGPSIIRTFGPEPGKGFFLRGDIGLAWLNYIYSSSLSDGENSDPGIGFLLGGGYGFAISEGTRLLLNVNYALRFVEEEEYGMLCITLGGLF